MLIPVLVRASFKITTSQLVVLENLVGSNLPLLFPEVRVANRTATTSSITVSGQVRNLFVNQPDPDFEGTLLYSPFVDFSVGNGQTQLLSGLSNSLTPATYGVTNEITLTRTSGAAEAWVTLIVKGMIESSVGPDPLVTINV